MLWSYIRGGQQAIFFKHRATLPVQPPMMSLFAFATLLASLSGVSGKTVKSPTPPMGWNSYNHYNCRPSEDIIKINAKGLVDLGFLDLGYSIVTVDCGWPSRDRDSEGRLQWNETLFPSGPKALGEYIHDLGLEFGLYSGAGYLQCGSSDIPASLGMFSTVTSSRLDVTNSLL